MKKTYSLQHAKIKYERLIESVRHDVKKVQNNQRRKPLPAEGQKWVFDCKFGYTEESAQVVELSEIKDYITRAALDKAESIYIEMIPRAAAVD